MEYPGLINEHFSYARIQLGVVGDRYIWRLVSVVGVCHFQLDAS